MNGIIGGLKEKNEFPEWYEGLHKGLYRANEFMGKLNKINIFFLCDYWSIHSDERAITRSEFSNMLLSWDIEPEASAVAYDFITEHGKKRMDCKLTW